MQPSTTLLLLTACLCSGVLCAQNEGIQRQVLGASGGVRTAGTHHVLFSVGQQGVTGGTLGLRQGYQQPPSVIRAAVPEQPTWNVFPNPTSGAFTVEGLTAEAHTLELRSADGRLVHRWERTTATRFSLPQGLAAGTYLLVEPRTGRSVRLQTAGT